MIISFVYPFLTQKEKGTLKKIKDEWNNKDARLGYVLRLNEVYYIESSNTVWMGFKNSKKIFSWFCIVQVYILKYNFVSNK